jgi:hypothetical protein
MESGGCFLHTESVLSEVLALSEQHFPGDGLLHPISLLSIALLVVNDHVLKSSYPGLLTGKLSDVAGMIFFPLLLQAVYELLQRVWRGSFTPSQRVLWAFAWLTALGFTLVKLTSLGGELYTRGLYLLQWPVLSLSRGYWMPLSGRVLLTQDVTDVLAVPCVLLAIWAGKKRLLLPGK